MQRFVNSESFASSPLFTEPTESFTNVLSRKRTSNKYSENNSSLNMALSKTVTLLIIDLKLVPLLKTVLV